MAQFSISGYDNESKCKICGSHASEHHHEGCELGAVYSEIKEARLVIQQFLKLLGVETITSALSKIAAEQQRALDGAEVCAQCGFPPSHHDPSCRHCGTINSFEYDEERAGEVCVRCGERKG